MYVLTALLSASCGNGPCGHYLGDVSFQEMFGTDTESCYTSIGGELTANITDGFTYFEMPYLRSIGGGLRIVYNYDLKSFDLRSLVYVKGKVEIEGNRILPDLGGLRSLSYIGGSLIIRAGYGPSEPEYFNEELSDISGLSNVESIAGDIRIENNPKLPTCAAEALVERLVYFLGIATISGNDNSASCD
jgi:hypothetical protein